MSKKAIIIVNPVAGKMKIKEDLPIIKALLKGQDYETKVYVTKAHGDASKVAEKFGHSRDLIVCCGGDGTLNEVISGLLKIEEKPKLLYYPCGSTNDFAATLGLPRNAFDAASDIDNRETMDLDVGMFNGELNFSYIASFGIFVKASYSAPQKVKNVLGHFAYVLEGAKELPTIGKSYHTKVVYDDGEIEGDFALVGVTNSTSAGGVLKLSKDAVSLSDGLFEVLLIRGIKNAADLTETAKLLLAKKTDGERVTLIHTTKVHIECEEAPAWCTDGEFAGNYASVDAECLHGAVRILI